MQMQGLWDTAAQVRAVQPVHTALCRATYYMCGCERGRRVHSSLAQQSQETQALCSTQQGCLPLAAFQWLLTLPGQLLSPGDVPICGPRSPKKKEKKRYSLWRAHPASDQALCYRCTL